MSGKLMITKLELQRGDGTSDPLPAFGWSTNIIKLKVTFDLKKDGGLDTNGDKRKRRSFGAKTINKYFDIHVRFDGTGVVDKCFSNLDGAVLKSLNAICESFHGGTGPDSYDLLAGCNGATGGVVIGTPATEIWSYCALTRAAGEDGYKDSTSRSCEVTRNLAPNSHRWTLTSTYHEGRSNYCKMTCFRL